MKMFFEKWTNVRRSRYLTALSTVWWRNSAKIIYQMWGKKYRFGKLFLYLWK